MAKGLFIKALLILIAPAVKIWNFLQTLNIQGKYMFGCDAISDWNVGSTVIWKGTYEGKK